MKQTNNASAMTDEAIIELYWNRDEQAITATDDKYGRYLYTIAYNIIHDSMDCEECLNDTYLNTWNRIPPTRPNLFQVFLSKITRNVAVDKFRKYSAAKRIPSELTESLDELEECFSCEMSVEEAFFVKQTSEILNDYLQGLSRREGLMFICRYYYSDSVDSIAKMLNVSKSTVSRELAKLREGLKERLIKEGYWYE